MKNFIEHIQKSIYSPEYYRNLLTRPASFSWKYYGSFVMLLALLMTVVTSVPLIPKLSTFLRALPTETLSYYPAELRVDIKGGQVSTNVAEPYFIGFSKKGVMQSSTTPTQQLLVIDTKSEVTLQHYNEYNSIFWLSQDALNTINNDGSLRSVQLGNVDSIIDAVHIKLFISEIQPYFSFIPPLVVLVIFLGLIVSFVVMLAYLLFVALLIYLLGLLIKENWSYFDAYRISLHAVTLPLLFTSVLYLLPIPGLQLPFLTSLLAAAVVYVNFHKVPISTTDKGAGE